MRVFLIALCACGGPGATSHSPAAPTPVVAKKVVDAHAPVDVIAALAKPLDEVSWISPGPAQLVLGGASVQALEGAPRLEVGILEEQGNDIRVGVRLEHARFALWMAKSRMLAIIARGQRIEFPGVFQTGPDPMQVLLHAGALVQRIAKEKDRTKVRYVGALEVEGWVPSDALVDRAPAGRTAMGRIPTGRKTLMLMPGAVIRVEPKWAAQQLALMNQGYLVDEVKPIDQAWSEVVYEDGDVAVHGYVSKHAPPGRTHRKKQPEQTAPLTPNVNAPNGTCLYIDGEPIGFIVETQAVVVEPSSKPGWSVITLETPWGPIGFDAKGSPDTELATCGS